MELAERAIKQREDLAEQLAKIERGIAEERGALDARIPAQGELAAREADASKRAETSNAALEAAHADHLRARRRERLHEAATARARSDGAAGAGEEERGARGRATDAARRSADRRGADSAAAACQRGARQDERCAGGRLGVAASARRA